MANRSVYRISVDPVVEEDIIKITEGADDLAFEHATAIAASSNISLGSDIFASIYIDLADKYGHTSEHMFYLIHIALQGLQSMLETDLIRIVPKSEGGRCTREDVGKALMTLAQVYTAGMVHTIASEHRLWMTNDEMALLPPDRRAVEFVVKLPPSKIPQEAKENE
jgi:hypothetical protein